MIRFLRTDRSPAVHGVETGRARRSAWLVLIASVVAVLLGTGPARAATVQGRIFDAESGAPVPWVDVQIDTGQGPFAVLSDPAGAFVFTNVPDGEHTLRASRIGYREHRETFLVRSVDDVVALEVSLRASAVALETVDVSGTTVEREDDLYADQTPVRVTGQELRERMGTTVADVLTDHGGVSEESMGPAPARPVVRGLSGNRVLILEDEIGTGDLSGTSPDHALVVDPLNASRIEVLRGPATLLYGSSVLGGVINVRREAVPLSRPERVRASIRYMGDTVNEGSAGRLSVTGPLGDLVYSVDAMGRTGDDVHTPIGDMRNTQIDAWNGSAGLSWVDEHAHVGVAVGRYDSDYGIPGGFLGGHPNGVDIELERRRYLLHAGRHFDDGPVESVELFGGYSRYFHREIESSGLCGVSFGLLNHQWTQRTHLKPAPWGRSILALQFQHRDFAQGCLSFVPPTIERTVAAAAYNEVEWGPMRWTAGVRGEFRDVDPSRRDENKAGVIRGRSFAGTGASIAAAVDHGRVATTTLTLTRSFRAPGLEELFSEGPHLAAFSYEVGNADLDSETGNGVELRFDWRGSRLSGALTGFYNRFDGFIHPVDTGELEFGPGSEGFLERWQYRGSDTQMVGGEARLTWRATRRLELRAETSYVRATDLDLDAPLPRMPPLSGRVSARLRTGEWTWAAHARGAGEQGRVSEFEEPTSGYLTYGASVEWNRLGEGTFQSVMLRADNLTDAEYRNHLSRIRSILPEPGRNVTLMVRAGLF